MYPMRCTPVFKQAIWGGNRLKTVLHKQYAQPTMAESWELSCHSDGLSGIANGVFANRTLLDVLREHPGFAGTANGGEFPLLIKFIDANDDLSVQVHPTPQSAITELGQQSKTEVWIVMDCMPGAALYYGLNRRVDQNEFMQRARDGTVCDILNRVTVKKGDVFHIHAGTVHAIGAGILIAEIQQSANTTFRVYDYMRRNDRGELRPLHIEEAARAANLAPTEGQPARPDVLNVGAQGKRECVFDSPLFTIERYDIDGAATLTAEPSSFDALLFIQGKADIVYAGTSYPAKKGDCYFIPAGMGRYDVAGRYCMLRSRVPQERK